MRVRQERTGWRQPDLVVDAETQTQSNARAQKSIQRRFVQLRLVRQLAHGHLPSV